MRKAAVIKTVWAPWLFDAGVLRPIHLSCSCVFALGYLEFIHEAVLALGLTKFTIIVVAGHRFNLLHLHTCQHVV